MSASRSSAARVRDLVVRRACLCGVWVKYKINKCSINPVSPTSLPLPLPRTHAFVAGACPDPSVDLGGIVMMPTLRINRTGIMTAGCSNTADFVRGLGYQPLGYRQF